jgi:hypothetical protein
VGTARRRLVPYPVPIWTSCPSGATITNSPAMRQAVVSLSLTRPARLQCPRSAKRPSRRSTLRLVTGPSQAASPPLPTPGSATSSTLPFKSGESDARSRFPSDSTFPATDSASSSRDSSTERRLCRSTQRSSSTRVSASEASGSLLTVAFALSSSVAPRLTLKIESRLGRTVT